MSNLYCCCCGQLCKPVRGLCPSKDGGGLVTEWISQCCGDALSEVPVTDQCDQCGAVAARGEEFVRFVDTSTWCPGCLADYTKDHPSLAGLSEDDFRKDR